MAAADPLLRISRTVALRHTPAELWPILSATDKLNREWGLPAVEYTPRPNERGGADIEAQAQIVGVRVKWDEHPFEWIEPTLWRVKRVYSAGPLKSAIFGLTLARGADGRTQATFSCDYQAGFTTRWFLRIMLNDWLKKAERSAQAADDFLDQKAPSPFVQRYRRAPINGAALALAAQRLTELQAPPALVDLLCEDLSSLPEEDVVRMRPFEIADRWKKDRMDVLVLFMRGVRAGLLDLSWQIICPHCRGANSGSGSLKQVRNKSRCDFCNITFDTEFDRSVEARFTVNADIRRTSDRSYCIGGPSKTPHIQAQLRLEPGQKREFDIELKVGTFRLRAAQAPNTRAVYVRNAEPGAPPVVNLRIDDSGFTPGDIVVPAGPVHFSADCQCSGHVDLKLETSEWLDTAATAMITTSMPEFYDLSSRDTLLPDEDLAVRSVTLLFSDLRGSTALYRQIGDAAAYALVREHFTVMEGVIRRCQGGVVKTIGDAVMASFVAAPEALACCFEIQRAFVELWSHHPLMAPIVVKLGFHRGPCIAVSPNRKIDYFGSMVNLAARIQAQSKGGDIVIAKELFTEPAIRQALSQYTYTTEEFSAVMKGVGAEIHLIRIIPDWGGRTLPQGTLVITKPHTA